MKTKFLIGSLATLVTLSLLLAACGNQGGQNKPNLSATVDITNKKTVLVVLSAMDSLEVTGGKVIGTGFFLDEFAVPAQALVAAGYRLEIATPNAGVPTMDEKSSNASYFHNDTLAYRKALGFVKSHAGLKTPLSLKAVAATDLKKYSAIFISGGRAPMTDLMKDTNLGKILNAAHREGKITALICNGPVALTAALADPVKYRAALVFHDEIAIKELSKDWIYKGYRMTIFSNAEEDHALKDKPYRLPFYVQDALQLAGGKTSKAVKNWAPHVVRDRELITGQNPGSDKALADTLIKVLAQH